MSGVFLESAEKTGSKMGIGNCSLTTWQKKKKAFLSGMWDTDNP